MSDTKNKDQEKESSNQREALNDILKKMEALRKKLNPFDDVKPFSNDDYKASVTQMADNKDVFEFSNSGPEHAGIVMTNIFRTANHYVFIFAGDLNGDVSDNYADSADAFIKRQGRIEVILQDFPKKKSKFICLLLKHKKNNKISFTRLENSSDSLAAIPVNQHMTISDDRMYRIEEDTKNYYAKVSFNNVVKTFDLKNKFVELSKLNRVEVTENDFL